MEITFNSLMIFPRISLRYMLVPVQYREYEYCLLLSLRSKRFRRVWEQRKTEERGFRYFACAENGARASESQKKNGGGRGGEGRNRLRTNPWILKTPVRWRTRLVIGWASRTFLTCVDQRS